MLGRAGPGLRSGDRQRDCARLACCSEGGARSSPPRKCFYEEATHAQGSGLFSLATVLQQPSNQLTDGGLAAVRFQASDGTQGPISITTCRAHHSLSIFEKTITELVDMRNPPFGDCRRCEVPKAVRDSGSTMVVRHARARKKKALITPPHGVPGGTPGTYNPVD